jgi:hypothetical protein
LKQADNWVRALGTVRPGMLNLGEALGEARH